MAWASASASSPATTFASSSTGDKTMETSFKWKLTKEVNEGMERLSWRLVNVQKEEIRTLFRCRFFPAISHFDYFLLD